MFSVSVAGRLWRGVSLIRRIEHKSALCCFSQAAHSSAPTIHSNPAEEVNINPKDSAIVKNFSQSVLPDKLYKTIEVEVLGYEPSVLDSYQWFVLTAASHLGIQVGRVWEPRKSDKFRFSLLKSVHIFKKHQVQYEVRTYHRFFTFVKLTGSTASTYLEYIQRNIPEGVAMKVTQVEILPRPDFLNRT